MKEKSEKTNLATEVVELVKERWPLVAGTLVFLIALVIASHYVYKEGLAVRGSDNEQCVIRLLIESQEGGKQWMTITPKDNSPSIAEFEGVARLHRIEATSCL